MGDVWYPGAVRMPGARAGYDRGRNTLRCCVLHYTVGVDSTNVGLDGYFNFLVRRNGEVVQFAPVDALTWHAGEWNPDGPGIEHEFYEPHDGPAPENILNPAMELASGSLCLWLRDAHGVPGSFYDGARVSRGQPGFITHRSLVQSQEHFDYITADQWARMTSGAPAKPPIDWAAIAAAVAARKRQISRRRDPMHVARSKDGQSARLFDNNGSSSIAPAAAKTLIDRGVDYVDGLDTISFLAHYRGHDPVGFARDFPPA